MKYRLVSISLYWVSLAAQYSRAAKLPVTLIFVIVTGNVTVTLVTMTEIAENQVYVCISLKCAVQLYLIIKVFLRIR